jgi:hypothetical protein
MNKAEEKRAESRGAGEVERNFLTQDLAFSTFKTE